MTLPDNASEVLHSHVFLVEGRQILRAHVAALTPHAPDAAVRRLLFLGRIETEQGIYDLFAAFEMLSSDYPDATLEFAGDGNQASAPTCPRKICFRAPSWIIR